MKINIETGPCRNEDVGDWWRDEYGTIQIRVAPMADKSAVAVAIHELIEILRCEEDGVSDADVTEFDAQFLAEQKAGEHSKEEEPGNDPRAPYHIQHIQATIIERAVCRVFSLPWPEHERNVAQAGE